MACVMQCKFMEYFAQMLAQHFKYPLPTLLWNEYHMVFTSTWKFSDEVGAKQSGFLKDAAKHQSGIIPHHNWTPLPGQRWFVEVDLLKVEKTNFRVTPECILRLVAFANGSPISHTLLIGKNNQWIFHLPK